MRISDWSSDVCSSDLVGGARASWWLETLRDLLPELEVRAWDDPGDRSQVEYAVVWQPPPGGLKTFPNLKAIVSMGAGVDHVLRDPELPRHQIGRAHV